VPSVSSLEKLDDSPATRWPTLTEARARSSNLRKELSEKLQGAVRDDNVAVIVTGSVGRMEVTEGSDIDWYLLIDGPSDPKHAQLVATVRGIVKEFLPKDVGETGTFATMVASHDLVHHIAGTQDSNTNLTRRVLLLAESHALVSPVVRERVLRNVLSRYVESALTLPSDKSSSVPLFLVNDIVRYWRTMATDYASKTWERNNKGWAIRNIKLRFSRKLLFVWGLLASFSGHLFPSKRVEEAEDETERRRFLAQHVLDQTNVAPLELLARVAAHKDVSDGTRADIFDSYEAFLLAMSHSAERESLEKLSAERASTDEAFGKLRATSRNFRRGIERLFFEEHPILKNLIRQYGVF